ncbi:6-phosphogluconate dehydrogenase [Bordetella tumbae]|uniref:NAD(P)-dependent oxidoreductase n=1 Tax=Bordetella tumbae TaxID=1649139 RepID=UPI0039EFC0BC
MKIGYIGLGALGGQLARTFLGKHELHVWDANTTVCSAFAEAGAQVATSAIQLARDCEVILLCLPRSADVHQVVFGPGGLSEGLSAGQLVIDQTSGVPAETHAMALELQQRGVVMIDAAVSASPHIVAEGGATLMVGASDEAYERALPVLRAVTKTIYRCGIRVGDGQAMKMVNNAMNAGVRLGTLEVVAMGRGAGLSLTSMTDLLNKGAARNQTTVKMLPAIAAGKASTNFSLALQIKDVNQAVVLGMQTGVPMPLMNIVRGLLQIGLNTVGKNAQLEDMVTVIESMAGTRFRDDNLQAQAEHAGDVHDVASMKIGFVGLGAMGGSLARRLMQSQHIHVYDTREEVRRQFEREGAVAADDLASLATHCDVIFLCLPNSAAVHDALFSAEGLSRKLAPQSLVIDMTSGDPVQSRRFADRLQKMGMGWVDAPVSGMPDWALAGTIAIMTGGTSQDCARARPALEAISTNIVTCGQVGNGHLIKLVNNAVSSLCRLVTYECAAAGFKYGLSLSTMAEVLAHTSGWSGVSQRALPVLGTEAKSANFQIQLMVKDLRLAANVGMACGAPMMISNAVRTLFETGHNGIGGTANIDDMAHLYEAMAGIKFQQDTTLD